MDVCWRVLQDLHQDCEFSIQLEDPNVPAELREMAEEMLRMSRNESAKVIINASNSLIRRLARQNLRDPDVLEVMRGVYNNAVLVNQDLMTPTTARLFHDYFQKLMTRNLELLDMQAALRADLDNAMAIIRANKGAGES